MSKMITIAELYDYIKHKNKTFEDFATEKGYVMIECDKNNVYQDDDFDEFLRENKIKVIDGDSDKIIISDDETTVSLEFKDVTNRFDFDCPDETIYDFGTMQLIDNKEYSGGDLLKDIGRVMKFTIEQLEKETGSTVLEIGEEVATVFNNGILILSMEENRRLKTKVILDKPFFMDFAVGGIADNGL